MFSTHLHRKEDDGSREKDLWGDGCPIDDWVAWCCRNSCDW